jgi:hypothetical protein
VHTHLSICYYTLLLSLQLTIPTGNREQVDSAEPSPKRRRVEFDVITLDLAENARNLRYYLLLQCLGPEELRKRSDSDLEMLRKQQSDSGLEKLYDQLSRPACTTELPFPFPGMGKPIERFTFTDGICWSYMGREYFITLLNEVTQLMGSVTRKLSLYGTIGYGKSYLLAALVCYLTVHGTRIVYIPDCRECCEEPLTYFQAAMLFTWADDIGCPSPGVSSSPLAEGHDSV